MAEETVVQQPANTGVAPQQAAPPAQEAANEGYGYTSDEVKVSPFNFGLNTPAFLKKFEWIGNGGKDGAEQEALDIVFNINGTDKSYRLFPVTKAYLKGNTGETTEDRNAPEFKEAVLDLNSRIVHILHAFHQDGDTVKQGLSVPNKGFKDFIRIAASILPQGYDKIPLDIFMQFQWQISEGQNRTYLDIPQKMKYGAWLTPATTGAEWKEMRVDDPTENTREALYYINTKGPVDDKGNPTQKHRITKNGWFMLSNFANQQRNAEAQQQDAAGGAPASAAAPSEQAAAIQEQGEKKAVSW